MNSSWITMTMLISAAMGVAISYADLYLFHIMMAIYLISQAIKLKAENWKGRIVFIQNHYSLFMVILLVWYGISIMWAPDTMMGLKYLFYIFCGTTIALSVIHFGHSINRIKLLVTMLGLIFCGEIIVALLESFTSFRLPISPYSNWHIFFGKESVDFYAFDNPFVYSDFRPPTGFHWNTNNLAITMIMILPFFLCSQKVWIKVVGSAAITMITILAASRAVFIALLLIFCLYLIIIKKQLGTLSLIWVTIISLFWGMSILAESDDPRINEVANSIEAMGLYLSGDIDIGGSLEWRRELVNNGMAAFFETKGLGVGGGGSMVLQERMGRVAGRFTSMHNFWVEILVEGGIIIAVLFMIWYGQLLTKLWQISKNNEDSYFQYLAQSLLLAMLGFIPAAIAASSTIYFFPMWIMFGVSISLVLIGQERSISPIREKPFYGSPITH